MDDKHSSTSVEESITSLPNEVEECEQQSEETTEKKSNVVDFQAAATESREVRAQNSMVTMKDYQTKFQAMLKSLNDAALKFREQTEVSFKQCREIVLVLQNLRRLTNDCLEVFHNGNAPFGASYSSVTNSLYILDGEKTARLILEVDLFENLVMRKSMSRIGEGESLARARERIKMHVDLQSSLRDEGKQIRELIEQIEKLPRGGSISPNGSHKILVFVRVRASSLLMWTRHSPSAPEYSHPDIVGV